MVGVHAAVFVFPHFIKKNVYTVCPFAHVCTHLPFSLENTIKSGVAQNFCTALCEMILNHLFPTRIYFHCSVNWTWRSLCLVLRMTFDFCAENTQPALSKTQLHFICRWMAQGFLLFKVHFSVMVLTAF